MLDLRLEGRTLAERLPVNFLETRPKVADLFAKRRQQGLEAFTALRAEGLLALLENASRQGLEILREPCPRFLEQGEFFRMVRVFLLALCLQATMALAQRRQLLLAIAELSFALRQTALGLQSLFACGVQLGVALGQLTLQSGAGRVILIEAVPHAFGFLLRRHAAPSLAPPCHAERQRGERHQPREGQKERRGKNCAGHDMIPTVADARGKRSINDFARHLPPLGATTQAIGA